MLYVYLFSTILGGLLLAASMAGGGHHGGDGAHLHDGSAASALFSLRLWTYLLTFGGGTGLLLHFFTAASPILAAALAGSVGLVSSLTARATIRRMLNSGGGGTIQQHELVGRSAEVLVPAARGATGTVRLTVKNSTVDLLAVCEDAELSLKDQVIIFEVKDGLALVTRNPTS
jgi:membrane protein implicated in regulation of membrane protease activity